MKLLYYQIQTTNIEVLLLKLGINHVSNTEYHADKEYLSSSNYKTLLEDPEKFHREKILGIKEEQKESTSFTEGSLTHSVILEPHLVNTEYAFFPGLRKSGPEFTAFAEQNKGKTIISKPQKIRVDNYKSAYLKNKAAVELVKGGFSEQTLCVELNGIKTKTRCDYINVDAGYILDVKTSAYPVDVDTFRNTIKMWSYDLSAALYTKVASEFYNKNFKFYFVCISKTDLVCEVFKASDATLEQGMQKILKATKIYKQCMSTGIWKPELTKHASSGEILEV